LRKGQESIAKGELGTGWETRKQVLPPEKEIAELCAGQKKGKDVEGNNH